MENIQSTDLFKVIGKNIKYYRSLYNLEKGKMTQEKLAELADVSTALIANVESDKISKALEIPVENLFNGIDNDISSLHA